MLKCEYPEGCRLDLWAKVIKAKYVARQVRVLDTTFCVPENVENAGKIQYVDDIKVKVLEAYEDLNFNRVKIFFRYEIVLFVIVNGSYQLITVEDSYEQNIDLDEFDPPLCPDEFRLEISDSELLLCNWNFDYEIRGACEDPDPCNPCRPTPGTPPVAGTCLRLVVYVDIIDKLGKMHDIIVYGEINPVSDC